MIFRWSHWGENNICAEMLYWSITSFKKQFGNKHRYIVFAEDKNYISEQIPVNTEVYSFVDFPNSLFNINSKATWKKWCPTPRVDIKETEFYVDTDVFLLDDPIEIHDFLANAKLKFAVLDEFRGEPWQHGSMRVRATNFTPYINAGLFVQKANEDISQRLFNEFNWWLRYIKPNNHTHHDEQGCLAIALTDYFNNKELYILPKIKYCLVSEDQNSQLTTLNNITLIHATYPKHPAFHRFYNSIVKAAT